MNNFSSINTLYYLSYIIIRELLLYTSLRKELMLRRSFIQCGITGWCIEVMFTGFHSFLRRDFRLMSQTSILMFPIYGMAAFIKPIYKYIKNWNILVRGILYTISIFLVEYFTGNFLCKKKICPWDYTKSKYNIKGVIRLDFAPLWFFTGLLFEHLLCHFKESS